MPNTDVKLLRDLRDPWHLAAEAYYLFVPFVRIWGPVPVSWFGWRHGVAAPPPGHIRMHSSGHKEWKNG